jgi:hypothetical protein
MKSILSTTEGLSFMAWYVKRRQLPDYRIEDEAEPILSIIYSRQKKKAVS